MRTGSTRWQSLAVAALCAAMAQAGDSAETVIEHQRGLVPVTAIRGPVLEVDFPGLSIGIAEYDEGPTGTTVFHFDRPTMAAVDVRGGAPGTIGTDGLRLAYDDWSMRAISLSGGSAYGLAAATGVTDAIKDRTANPGDWRNIVGVAGAIIFDLGARRFNAVTPDYALGQAALAAAAPGRFPLGAQGAGRFAMQGWHIGDPVHSGQGGAVTQVGPVRIAFFTVVNSAGPWSTAKVGSCVAHNRGRTAVASSSRVCVNNCPGRCPASRGRD